MLEIESVSWSVQAKTIIDDVSLMAQTGQFVGLIGANGSGKSSLLRTIYRVLKPDAGLVTVAGQDVWQLSARESARQTAVVTQERTGEFDFTVYEIVMMGRNPHKGTFERDTAVDEQIVQTALHRVNVDHLRQRYFQSLSGGEKQRVFIARALTQQARYLVLDEPTNHLDIRYQLEILALVKELGVTTIAALHDLNLAAAFCDHLYLLHQGKLLAAGRPDEVLTPTLIQKSYGVQAVVGRHPVHDHLHLAFVYQNGHE